jgi:hypothetical protein
MTSNRWWETGNQADYAKYSGGQQAIRDAFARGEIDEATRNALQKQQAEQQFGAKSFDIGEFEGLLGRLEASKGRQQRQKSTEGRRDIYAQGLAQMMSNF